MHDPQSWPDARACARAAFPAPDNERGQLCAAKRIDLARWGAKAPTKHHLETAESSAIPIARFQLLRSLVSSRLLSFNRFIAVVFAAINVNGAE